MVVTLKAGENEELEHGSLFYTVRASGHICGSWADL
jgi:hypothetical protein